MRTVYREKRYVCGEYLDTYVYPVYEAPRKGGKRVRRGKSTPAQVKLNQRHRVEKLTRLLHANFSPNDLELHLTYRGDQPTEAEAARELANFLRRVRRYRQRHGLGELKYVAVTERGQKSGRIHHHITINGGIDRDVLEGLWRRGYANSRRLQFTENGLAGLSRYVTKSPQGGKAWSASKNLVHPAPQVRDGKISGKKAREMAERAQDCGVFEALYPGYHLASVEVFPNEVNNGVYLFARLYKKIPKKKTSHVKGGEKSNE